MKRTMLSLLMVFAIIGCREKRINSYSMDIWVAQTHVAVPEEFRKIIGYDSMQFIFNNDTDKIRVNFCYPNKWERYKWKDSAWYDTSANNNSPAIFSMDTTGIIQVNTNGDNIIK